MNLTLQVCVRADTFRSQAVEKTFSKAKEELRLEGCAFRLLLFKCATRFNATNLVSAVRSYNQRKLLRRNTCLYKR